MWIHNAHVLLMNCSSHPFLHPADRHTENQKHRIFPEGCSTCFQTWAGKRNFSETHHSEMNRSCAGTPTDSCMMCLHQFNGVHTREIPPNAYPVTSITEQHSTGKPITNRCVQGTLGRPNTSLDHQSTAVKISVVFNRNYAASVVLSPKGTGT